MKKSIVIAIVGVLVIAGVGSAVYFQATKKTKVGSAVASTEQEVAVPSADDMEAQVKEVVAAKEAELEAQKAAEEEAARVAAEQAAKEEAEKAAKEKEQVANIILAMEIQVQNPINQVALELKAMVLLPVMVIAIMNQIAHLQSQMMITQFQV